ncbi:hypothetical protein NST81_02745 [Bacillus sp. FSL W8-0223]|uniref:hypothetical protein n=1 Tax=Bacillus sp. FSL W8-0223 TaxID=2954595 RepID=UPI0030FCEACA
MCDRCEDSGKVIEEVMTGVYQISLCDCQNAARVKREAEERRKKLKAKIDEAYKRLMEGM